MGGARYGQVQTKNKSVISGSSFLVVFDVVNVGIAWLLLGVALAHSLLNDLGYRVSIELEPKR